jgi:hypothetical protein
MLFFNQLLSSLEIVSTNTGVAINKEECSNNNTDKHCKDKSSNRLSTKINIIANTPIIVNEVLIVLDIVELIDLFTISGKVPLVFHPRIHELCQIQLQYHSLSIPTVRIAAIKCWSISIPKGIIL